MDIYNCARYCIYVVITKPLNRVQSGKARPPQIRSESSHWRSKNNMGMKKRKDKDLTSHRLYTISVVSCDWLSQVIT